MVVEGARWGKFYAHFCGSTQATSLRQARGSVKLMVIRGRERDKQAEDVSKSLYNGKLGIEYLKRNN